MAQQAPVAPQAVPQVNQQAVSQAQPQVNQQAGTQDPLFDAQLASNVERKLGMFLALPLAKLNMLKKKAILERVTEALGMNKSHTMGATRKITQTM